MACEILVAACGPSSLTRDRTVTPQPPPHWECGILAIGPPGQSLHNLLIAPGTCLETLKVVEFTFFYQPYSIGTGIRNQADLYRGVSCT